MHHSRAARSDHPCAFECDRLVALADAMPALAHRRRFAFASWYRDLYALTTDAQIETLAGERALDACVLELRRLWMATAHEYADATYRSPIAGTPSDLPASPALAYSYERSIERNAIEERLAAYRPVPPGWRAEHFLYSSGMAAITGCFTALPGVLGAAPGERIPLVAAGAYFETLAALEVAHGIAPSIVADERGLVEHLARHRPRAVFVEPIVYDVDLMPVDMFAVVDAIAAQPDPPALILDSTLVGPALPMARLLTHLRFSGVPAVIQISSGLKLDQAGLELANAGMLSIYVPERDDGSDALDAIATHVRTVRRLAGTALSLDAIALLDVPFFLDPASFYEYTAAVFDHNAALARALSAGGIFERIVHPVLHGGDMPWAVAPFVMCHVADDDPATARAIEAIVDAEARRRGLAFERGGSFGFRSHRFEAIELAGGRRRTLFKIALGARRGPSLAGITELLSEVAAARDVDALRARF